MSSVVKSDCIRLQLESFDHKLINIALEKIQHVVTQMESLFSEKEFKIMFC